MPKLPPRADSTLSLRALQALIKQRHLLAALEVMNQGLGDIFRLALPGFNAIALVGPEANRFVHIRERDRLLWRPEKDPVTRLLRHGVLVEDGESHDRLREQMNPSFHRQMLTSYVDAMVHCTDQVCAGWRTDSSVDMLVEMRRIALLILVETLFRKDFTPDMERLWRPILRSIAYISPGPWLLWSDIPRPGYTKALKRLDDYLFEIIRMRRANLGDSDDLLGLLIATPGISDDLIRDQLLTMLIAGHDTSTALLAWTLYLVGKEPTVMEHLVSEIDSVLGNDVVPNHENTAQLKYLEQVIKESLRLYPPIHLGQRIAAADLTFQGYDIPANTRILYSIYLTHRQPRYWPNPERFDPERFHPSQNRSRPAYTYVPFGGGPRICIGFAFAQVEARIVLARIFQKFRLKLAQRHVHPHMGATLEPRPGVTMVTQAR